MNRARVKQVLSMILVFATTVTLVGCGKSAPADSTEAALAVVDTTAQMSTEATEDISEAAETEATEESTEATEETTKESETTDPTEAQTDSDHSDEYDNSESNTSSEPVTTQPPATVPTETAPPATKPVETQPATTPQETAPPATEPPAPSEPIETQPVATNPPETVPPATEPAETQPEVTIPPTTGNIDGECTLHIYAVYTYSPTCTEKGYTISICSVCGHSEINAETDPTHTWTDWVTTKEPTSAESGEQTRTCKNCGVTETQSVEKLPDSEVLDTGALIAYGNGYAASLGFTAVGGTLPGYYPASTREFTTMDAARGSVASKVYALYERLMALDGTIEGCRVSVSVIDNGNGTFDVLVYYG